MMDDEYEYEMGFKHRDCTVCEYDPADCYYNGFCQWQGRVDRQNAENEQLSIDDVIIAQQNRRK